MSSRSDTPGGKPRRAGYRPQWWRRWRRARQGDPPTGPDCWEDERKKRLAAMIPERDRQSLIDYLTWARARFDWSTPVLNVGSGGFSDIERGLSGLVLLRQDLQACPGVHFRCDAAHLPFPDGTLGGALLLSVLEHAEHPSALVAELARVLSPGAPLVISVPCVWPLHRFPSDYWRFMPDGVLLMLGDAFRLGDMRGTGKKGNLPVQILCTAIRNGQNS